MLFNAPMVRALLAGSKTQTRRVIKPHRSDDAFCLVDHGDGWWPYRSEDGESPNVDNMEYPFVCPYGRPGDRICVRETLGHHVDKGHYYAATGMHVGPTLDYELEPSPSVGIPARTIPSIHMPRWASRIQLEIVSVRVERLNDCSEADALAEGVKGEPCDHVRLSCEEIGCCGPTARGMYAALWDQINGAGSWAANPWVWVIEFKRVPQHHQK